MKLVIILLSYCACSGILVPLDNDDKNRSVSIIETSSIYKMNKVIKARQTQKSLIKSKDSLGFFLQKLLSTPINDSNGLTYDKIFLLYLMRLFIKLNFCLQFQIHMMQNHPKSISNPQSLAAILGLADFCGRSLSTGSKLRKMPLFEIFSVLSLKADFFFLTSIIYTASIFGAEHIPFYLTAFVCVIVSAWMALLDTQSTKVS